MGYTHPLHPPLTCVPIGMVIGALVFGLSARVLRRPALLVTARHCTILAFIGLFPTAALGYLDWQHFYGGRWILPIKMKMILAGVLFILLLLALILRSRTEATSKKVLPIYFLCFITVTAIGYFGGELVFGHEGGAGAPASGGQQEPKGPPEATYAGLAAILNDHCVVCHSGSSAPVGLKLDTYSELMAGSQNGPVVVPGKPDESEIVRRIKGLSQPRMPFGKPPLSNEEIGLITSWIEQGAPK